MSKMDSGPIFRTYAVLTLTPNQWLSAKLEVGERYIQVRAPDNGFVPLPSIITI